MEELISAYKEITGSDVEFKVFGTYFHKVEVNYTVLVCPKDCEKFKNLPLLSDAGEYIVKNENNRWTWYPQSSSSQRRVIENNKVVVPDHPEGYKYKEYRKWDTVSFLFYLQPGQYLKLPEGTYPEIIDNTGGVHIKGDSFRKDEAKTKLLEGLTERLTDYKNKTKKTAEDEIKITSLQQALDHYK